MQNRQAAAAATVIIDGDTQAPRQQGQQKKPWREVIGQFFSDFARDVVAFAVRNPLNPLEEGQLKKDAYFAQEKVADRRYEEKWATLLNPFHDFKARFQKRYEHERVNGRRQPVSISALDKAATLLFENPFGKSARIGPLAYPYFLARVLLGAAIVVPFRWSIGAAFSWARDHVSFLRPVIKPVTRAAQVTAAVVDSALSITAIAIYLLIAAPVALAIYCTRRVKDRLPPAQQKSPTEGQQQSGAQQGSDDAPAAADLSQQAWVLRGMGAARQARTTSDSAATAASFAGADQSQTDFGGDGQCTHDEEVGLDSARAAPAYPSRRPGMVSGGKE